ncbi:MAG: hypothetical protein A2Y04_02545 [Omnitrophica WOR_2 bacterium GWC2_45_7]|nr:MAG: hypothetical protein A2Y04_02545 [Omnitrophica WOR_2 bacterium GWC2_45_7]
MFVFGLFIVCDLVIIFEAMIGDFLWHLFSGDFISSFDFLGSFIQLLIPTIIIFLCWLVLNRPSFLGSSEGMELFKKELGFNFLAFPEDYFYRERNILERRKCRYLIFFRGQFVVEKLGNKFISLCSIFTDQILSIGNIDIFLYKSAWISLFAIMIIDSISNTAITTPIFSIGTGSLIYEMCLVALILILSAYLSHMVWRKYIVDHSRFDSGTIFRRRFLSLQLSAHHPDCIFICPIERFSEFDQKRAEHLCESFIKNSNSIYNGKVINLDYLKEWAANENIGVNERR